MHNGERIMFSTLIGAYERKVRTETEDVLKTKKGGGVELPSDKPTQNY